MNGKVDSTEERRVVKGETSARKKGQQSAKAHRVAHAHPTTPNQKSAVAHDIARRCELGHGLQHVQGQQLASGLKLVATSPGRSTALVKRDNTLLAPKGYTQRPIVPAESYDVVSFARAMNDDFAPRVQKLFKPETEAALVAQKTGVYISWRLPGQNFDCQRVGDMSRCFCGHMLGEHDQYNGRSVRVHCVQTGCACRAFEWVPSRPEDVGEFWFQRRRNFDPTSWRAKCRCKHTHEQHDCVSSQKRCLVSGCRCGLFESNFLCAACDKHWEQHQTFFETESARQRLGLPYGETYLPFAEMPNLRNAALTGDEGDDSAYLALTDGPYAKPKMISQTSGNDATVWHSAKPGSGFRPIYQ